MDTKADSLGIVLEHFGSVGKLAQALRCSPQAIYMWHGKVPKNRVYEIEVLTEGQVKASDLMNTEAA